MSDFKNKFDAVSLLITHYNRSASLERLLKTFAEQNIFFGEIIVSDDGSKPEYQTHLEELKKQYQFTLVTTPVNKGLGNNLNKGQLCLGLMKYGKVRQVRSDKARAWTGARTLHAYGISMGYIRDLGVKVGFINDNFWGDDGQLCLGLMKYGKVRQVRSDKARAWTGARTLQRGGKTFSQALAARISKEAKRFFRNFHSKLPEDSVKKTANDQ